MNQDFPRVTAVMCTGLPNREQYAVAAVRSFYAQDYPNRDLLILNHSKGEPYEFQLRRLAPEPPKHVRMREVMVSRFPTLGQMRSAALDHLDENTKFVAQWDDDDWSHFTRITRQMDHLKTAPAGSCCVLGAQVRYSFPQNTAFKHVNPESGIAGTILHPHDGNRYRAEHGTEDSTFLREHYLGQQKCTVLCNQDQPELYLRLFHDGNLCSAQHVMKVYARPQWQGCWVSDPQEPGYLSPHASRYLLGILVSEYGQTRLVTVLRQIRCTKCDKRYMGELAFQGRGAGLRPLPPKRWRLVWASVSPDAVTPFEGVCRKCV